jgi:hypothetical protein
VVDDLNAMKQLEEQARYEGQAGVSWVKALGVCFRFQVPGMGFGGVSGYRAWRVVALARSHYVWHAKPKDCQDGAPNSPPI